MLKTAHIVAGLALALTGGAANAQLAAHKDLTLPIAVAMAETAIQTCTAQGYKVSAHVLGRDAEVIVAMRGDGTGPHTLENSMRKAYTARMQRRPSGDFAKAAKENPTIGALHLANMIPAQGALPIKVGEDVIGAIGVSGAPGGEKDEACAKAGIDKVADQLK
ncbi:MAG TPA: heme-binding protein [Xanthobacteraceae bacterium]